MRQTTFDSCDFEKQMNLLSSINFFDGKSSFLYASNMAKLGVDSEPYQLWHFPIEQQEAEGDEEGEMSEAAVAEFLGQDNAFSNNNSNSNSNSHYYYYNPNGEYKFSNSSIRNDSSQEKKKRGRPREYMELGSADRFEEGDILVRKQFYCVMRICNMNQRQCAESCGIPGGQQVVYDE